MEFSVDGWGTNKTHVTKPRGYRLCYNPACSTVSPFSRPSMFWTEMSNPKAGGTFLGQCNRIIQRDESNHRPVYLTWKDLTTNGCYCFLRTGYKPLYKRRQTIWQLDLRIFFGGGWTFGYSPSCFCVIFIYFFVCWFVRKCCHPTYARQTAHYKHACCQGVWCISAASFQWMPRHQYFYVGFSSAFFNIELVTLRRDRIRNSNDI